MHSNHAHDILVRAFLTISTCAALFILWGGLFPDASARFLVSTRSDGKTNDGGDLYQFARIPLFKDELVFTERLELDPASSAQVIMMGDSFFYSALNGQHIPALVRELASTTVAYTKVDTSEFLNTSPLCLLEQHSIGYRDNKPLLVLELTEWVLPEYTRLLDRELALPPATQKARCPSPKQIATEKDPHIAERVDVFLLRNTFTYPIIGALRTLTYHITGKLHPQAPRAIVDPPLLFSDIEISHANRPVREAELKRIAASLKRLESTVRESYGLQLIVVIHPTKLSVYHDRLYPHSSNLYISKVQDALSAHNVPYIDAYQALRTTLLADPHTPLFYAGDSHTNPAGKSVVVVAITEALQSLETNH